MRARQVPWLLGSTVALASWLGTAATLLAAPIGPGGFTSPTLITFDSVAAPSFLGTSRPNPFAPLGVAFNGFVNPTVYPAPSSGNDLSPITVGADILIGVVRADFLPAAGPIFRVGADVGLGFQAAGILTAFDATGATLESLTGPTSTTFPQGFFLGLQTTAPIARVEFRQTRLDATTTTFPRIDNFRFEGQAAAVPEPGSFTLLIIGCAGLLSLGRRWRWRRDVSGTSSPSTCSRVRLIVR